jgi:hypothetical protein
LGGACHVGWEAHGREGGARKSVVRVHAEVARVQSRVLRRSVRRPLIEPASSMPPRRFDSVAPGQRTLPAALPLPNALGSAQAPVSVCDGIHPAGRSEWPGAIHRFRGCGRSDARTGA